MQEYHLDICKNYSVQNTEYGPDFNPLHFYQSSDYLISFLTLGMADMKKRKLMCMEALELFKYSWEQVLLLSHSKIGNFLKSPFNPLFVAAELGNIQFVLQLIRSYPDLIWKVNGQSQSVFHIAVIHRQEKVFRLIYSIGAHKDIIASYLSTDNENMLHLAAKIAPSNRLNIVSGAALQMQRELLWFKVIVALSKLKDVFRLN